LFVFLTQRDPINCLINPHSVYRREDVAVIILILSQRYDSRLTQFFRFKPAVLFGKQEMRDFFGIGILTLGCGDIFLFFVAFFGVKIGISARKF
jgi:hypothetical protein